MKTTLLMLAGLSATLAMAQNANAQVKVGDNAPAPSGVTDAGQKINFADVYSKQAYTLVYFYPKADTPGCTAQGCSLRDGYESLTQKGVAVIGVSHDDVSAQKAFKDKYHLPFTLIADTDDSVMGAFGVPTNMLGMAHRSAYLIKGGKVVYTDYKGTTKTQAQAILDVLAASGG
jgi:peroxiredoxin Q/BCP